MMAKWISSHRDLPLLLNQWANVLRWEMRPRMFLRTSEFLWQEGHTAHATADDAIAETMLALGLYQDVSVATAALATVPGEKTPRERFAGAERTFTIEAMMRDGRALQSGTSHFMGTKFAAAFGITFTGESGTAELCNTTSWGMSTRLIGGVIMSHGDDKGLVLPPALAPYQVVIVPIGRGEQAETMLSAATDLAATLQRAGIRTHVDDRPQLSPGFKFNDWEMRGVPIRLELGPRDLRRHVLMSRRLSYPGLDAARGHPARCGAGPAGCRARRVPGDAGATGSRFPRRPHSGREFLAEFVAAVAGGWALALQCGEQACEDEIKAETTATPRCIPLEGEPEQGACVRCGKASAYGKRVIFAAPTEPDWPVATPHCHGGV